MSIFTTIASMPIAECMTDLALKRACERAGKAFSWPEAVALDSKLELSIIMTVLEACSSDIDWSQIGVLKDVPKDLLQRQFRVSFGSGRFEKVWPSVNLSLGALAFLCSRPCRNAEKDLRGIVLAEFYGLRRCKAVEADHSEGVAAVCGMSLDDDGVIGRKDTTPGPLVLAFSTANDGKISEEIDQHAFDTFARKNGLDLAPTAETISQFLNHGLEHGPAYKDVILVSTSAHESVSPGYRASFRPQERTRYLVLFNEPLDGELLRSLIARTDAYTMFGELVENEALGARGTDRSCFDPVRVGYLPSGTNPTPYFSVLGGPYLLNPIPLAEKALHLAPTRAIRRNRPIASTKCNATTRQSSAPSNLRLKGVRLASLIAEHHPELVQKHNGLNPLVLSSCPFADEHRSNRGKADGSLFCFDPDITPYPVMRCHHATCGNRTTEEFVEAMISNGILDPLALQTAYQQEWDFPLPDVVANWRQHISKR